MKKSKLLEKFHDIREILLRIHSFDDKEKKGKKIKWH